MKKNNVSELVPKINYVGEGIKASDILTGDEIRLLSSITGKESFTDIALKNGYWVGTLWNKFHKLLKLNYILLDDANQREIFLKFAENGFKDTQSDETSGSQEGGSIEKPTQTSKEGLILQQAFIDMDQPAPDDAWTEFSEAEDDLPEVDFEDDADPEQKSRQGIVRAPHEKGHWDIDSLIPIITKIHKEKRTGKLRLIKDRNNIRSLFFENGELVNIYSKPFNPEECFGRILQKAGWIQQNDVIDSLQRTISTGKLQGEELVGMGRLRSDRLNEVLQFQLETKLAVIFQWRESAYDFTLLSRLPRWVKKIDVELSRLLFNMLWRHYPESEVFPKIIKEKEKWIGKVTNPVYPEYQFHFHKQLEKFWESVLDKDNLYKRVMIITNLKKEQANKFLWLLYILGMIEFLDDSREDKSLARIHALSERLKYIDKENAFDLLGVHWTSNNLGILNAFEKLKKEHDKKIAMAKDVEKQLLEEIFQHILKAYEEIRTRENRQIYRKKFYEETFIEFNADIFCQKGESFLFTKDEYLSAIDELESAVEILDTNGEYFVALGLAKFFHHFPRDIAEYQKARAMLSKGYSMISQTEIANLCMGMMHRKEMRMDKALHFYELALKANPGSRFAKMEIKELKTGKTAEDREKVLKDFVDRRSDADKKFDEMMRKKKMTS